MAQKQLERLNVEIRSGNPGSLKLLEKNARYMTAAQMSQLADNIQKDGVLTSLPLVHNGDVLSGNHRVEAAVMAGLKEISWIEVIGDLDDSRRIAIQLSHNAIVGQDDPSMLLDLYDGLDLYYKQYSGLTDDYFDKIDDLSIAGMGIGATAYEEFLIAFLPLDAEEFQKHIERIEKHAQKRTAYCAQYDDFTKMFDALIAVKKNKNIHNTGVAITLMAELAVERIEQLEAEAAAAGEDGKD